MKKTLLTIALLTSLTAHADLSSFIHNKMQDEVDRMRESVPIQVEDGIYVTAVALNDKQMHFTALVKTGDIPVSSFMAYMRTYMEEAETATALEMCRDPAMKLAFDMGYSVKYDYFSDKQYLFSMGVSGEDCKADFVMPSAHRNQY
mgnify:CR=1 FL=1